MTKYNNETMCPRLIFKESFLKLSILQKPIAIELIEPLNLFSSANIKLNLDEYTIKIDPEMEEIADQYKIEYRDRELTLEDAITLDSQKFILEDINLDHYQLLKEPAISIYDYLTDIKTFHSDCLATGKVIICAYGYMKDQDTLRDLYSYDDYNI